MFFLKSGEERRKFSKVIHQNYLHKINISISSLLLLIQLKPSLFLLLYPSPPWKDFQTPKGFPYQEWGRRFKPNESTSPPQPFEGKTIRSYKAWPSSLED